MAKRTLHALLCATLIVLPASAGHSADRDDDAFAEHFDTTTPAPVTVQDGVDITTFDPPVEPAPQATDLGRGMASYYGRKFNGRRTASGERFDMTQLTAAHRTLPFGSRVQVTNPRNGKTVVVRINDRGPFTHARTIDLSRAAAEELGLVSRGHGEVQLALLD